MTKKISETLTTARSMIADITKWTQGTHARDASGSVVEINDKDAVCYCADGALGLAAGVEILHGEWQDNQHYDAASRVLRDAARHLTGESSYVMVNDGDIQVASKESHAGILAVFDYGIDIAKSREELGITRVAP